MDLFQQALNIKKIFLKKKLSRSRLELETVCVLDRRDNHLHQRDLFLILKIKYLV